MKIEIKTEMVQLSLEMEPLKAFDLIQTAIKYAAEMPGQGGFLQAQSYPYEEVTREKAGRAQATLDKLTEEGNVPGGDVVPVDRTVVDRMERKASRLYMGFLYTKCEKCGMSRGYNAKIPTDSYKCRCGHETKLENLKQLHMKCACGKSFDYRTNKTEDSFEMWCIDCGKLNTMVLNAAKTAYVNMGRIKW